MTRPFTVDPILTAIAIGFRNPAHALIADRVLPRVDVFQEEFKWTEYPVAESFSVPDTEVGRRGQPPVLEFTGTERSAATTDQGLDADIPYTDIDAAAKARAAGLSTFDPEKRTAAELANLINLRREVRAAAVVQDAGNYSAGRKITLAGGDQLSAFGTSDPYAVIDAAMNGPLIYRANTQAMGKVVWNTIKRHPKLLNAVKGDIVEGAITRQQYADLFEIDVANLLIGEGYANTAKKGQPLALTQIWGKSIQCLYIDPMKSSTTDNTLTWGMTAQLGGKISGSWDDPKIGLKGGKWVRTGEQVKELVVAKDLGYRIGDVIA